MHDALVHSVSMAMVLAVGFISWWGTQSPEPPSTANGIPVK